jgi:ABC-type sulfate transport system permease subunit
MVVNELELQISPIVATLFYILFLSDTNNFEDKFELSKAMESVILFHVLSISSPFI